MCARFFYGYPCAVFSTYEQTMRATYITPKVLSVLAYFRLVCLERYDLFRILSNCRVSVRWLENYSHCRPSHFGAHSKMERRRWDACTTIRSTHTHIHLFTCTMRTFTYTSIVEHTRQKPNVFHIYFFHSSSSHYHSLFVCRCRCSLLGEKKKK